MSLPRCLSIGQLASVPKGLCGSCRSCNHDLADCLCIMQDIDAVEPGNDTRYARYHTRCTKRLYQAASVIYVNEDRYLSISLPLEDISLSVGRRSAGKDPQMAITARSISQP